MTGQPDLEALLERHLPALRAFVRLRAGPLVAARESGQDLVQSVCRELLAGQERLQYQGEAAFRAWLYTAALRKIRAKDRYWRAHKRDARQEVRADPGGDDSGEQALLDGLGHLLTPSRDAAAREQVARLDAAFARLAEDDREVITLARIAGLTHAEIAAQIGCSEETSRARLRRALVRLSGLLEP